MGGQGISLALLRLATVWGESALGWHDRDARFWQPAATGLGDAGREGEEKPAQKPIGNKRIICGAAFAGRKNRLGREILSCP